MSKEESNRKATNIHACVLLDKDGNEVARYDSGTIVTLTQGIPEGSSLKVLSRAVSLGLPTDLSSRLIICNQHVRNSAEATSDYINEIACSITKRDAIKDFAEFMSMVGGASDEDEYN